MARTVTMKGKPLALAGEALAIGSRAPDFELLDASLATVTLKDFPSQVKIVSVTPSIDTQICELQAKRFDAEAATLPGVAVLNVSVDLPFALRRFATTCGLGHARLLSDHRSVAFGQAWGVLVGELRILARAIFVLDKDNIVRHAQLVPEIGSHPDYDAALAAARALAS